MSKKTTKFDETEVETVIGETITPETETSQAVAESTEGLVQMHKDGEQLHVHPTTVEAHKQAGWKHA